MEIELAPIEHPSDEQHHSGGSNVILKSSDRQSTFGGTRISDTAAMAYNISKSRYSLFLTLNYTNLFYIYHWKEDALFMSKIAQDEYRCYHFLHKFGNRCWSIDSFCNGNRIRYGRTQSRFSISNILIINSWKL